ncbi:hypothetical protein B0I35DRAFT_140950 [Stachybotrys elegans]|uniref:Uncharacterized protein n=1 Tax=Stachybotrys elegans TaxID=80388 RepID=A0A8K0SZP1_9HYPO|nr:hypothetical protein B0I35DRAFT_140950 [Stachybotrys elegans]
MEEPSRILAKLAELCMASLAQYLKMLPVGSLYGSGILSTVLLDMGPDVLILILMTLAVSSVVVGVMHSNTLQEANFGWMALFLAVWHAPRLLLYSNPGVAFQERLISCLGDYVMVCTSVAAAIIVTYRDPTKQEPRIPIPGDAVRTPVASEVWRIQGPRSEDASWCSRDDDCSESRSIFFRNMGPRSLPSIASSSDAASSIPLHGDERIDATLVMETVHLLNTIRGPPDRDRPDLSEVNIPR